MDRTPRFFVEKRDILGKKVRLTDEQVNHIRKSLRMTVGDEIVIFDGEGNNYRAQIQKVTNKVVETELLGKYNLDSDEVKITLVQSIPKAKKFDLIVKKLTEIGITDIYPIETQYSILRAKDVVKKYNRCEKLIIEACKQSGRDVLLKLNEPITMKNFPDFQGYDLKLFASAKGSPRELKMVLNKYPEAKSIVYLIGPEGDFTREEMEIFKDNGFIQVSLGKNILRTETAAIYVGSILKYIYS